MSKNTFSALLVEDKESQANLIELENADALPNQGGDLLIRVTHSSLNYKDGLAVTGKGKGSYAGFANHFRYEMLLKCSNTFWVDMDVICLAPFYINDELDFGFENETYINNAVIGTKSAGNKLFSNLSKYCDNPFQFTRWDTFKFLIRKLIGRTWGRGDFSYLPWGITGPKALTGFVKKGELLNYAAPVQKYYPISSADWKKIFFASDEHINLDGAQAVHLWNEQLRRDNLDKNTVFDKESLYERLISDLKLDE